MDFKDLFFEVITKPGAKSKRYGQYLNEPVSFDHFKEACDRISNFNMDNEFHIKEFYKIYSEKLFPNIISKDKKEYSKYFFRTECLGLGSNSTQDDYWLSRGWLSKKEIEEQRRKKYATGSLEFGKEKGLTEKESQKRIDRIQSKIKKKRRNTYIERSQENPDYWKEQNVFSKEHWIKRGYNEDEARELAKIESDKQTDSIKKFHKENPGYMKDKTPVSVDRWLKEGYTKEEAEQIVSEQQQLRAFTLDKCIERYGEIEGRKRFDDRQKLWKSKVFNSETYIGHGTSISAKKFIDKILKNIKNPEKYLHGKNEKFIKHDSGACKYDFTDKKARKIIEFNGDYWHCNPAKYSEDFFHTIKQHTAKEIWDYDKFKIELASKYGYKVKVVWEQDYKNNPDKVIKECLEFLNN